MTLGSAVDYSTECPTVAGGYKQKLKQDRYFLLHENESRDTKNEYKGERKRKGKKKGKRERKSERGRKKEKRREMRERVTKNEK